MLDVTLKNKHYASSWWSAGKGYFIQQCITKNEIKFTESKTMSTQISLKIQMGLKTHCQRNSTVTSYSIQWLKDAEDRASSFWWDAEV